MQQRPISPHLQVYRMPMLAVLSITHRLTGIFLTLGMVMVVVWLVALASGPASYDMVGTLLGSILGQAIMFGFTVRFSITYSMVYGICFGISVLLNQRERRPVGNYRRAIGSGDGHTDCGSTIDNGKICRSVDGLCWRDGRAMMCTIRRHTEREHRAR